jgi:branched-chain amino acid transport system permease protein
LWGPVVGALALHVLADLTRNMFGQLPGINMVVYGCVLVLIVMFLPRGVGGIGQHWFKRTQASTSDKKEST